MYKKIFKKILLISLCAVFLSMFSACKKSDEKETIKYSSVDQFHNVKLGLATGSVYDTYLQETFPDCEINYYSSASDKYLSVEEGKVVAFWMDGPKALAIAKERNDLYYLSDSNYESQIAFAFADTELGKKLQNEMNSFLAKLKDDGTLERLTTNWIDNLALDEVDDSGLVNINGEINVSICSGEQPFLFVYNNKITGLEYDVLVRFAREYGYSLNIEDSTFDGVISAVSLKRCDMAAAAISVSEERKKSFLFSDPVYICYPKCLVLKDNLDVEIDPLIYLNGKEVGVVAGSMHADVAQKYLPASNIAYFNTYTDMYIATSLGKIAACLNDEAIAKLAIKEFDNLYIGKNVDYQDYCIMLAKSEFATNVTTLLNEYIATIESTGELDTIRDYWLNGIRNETIDYDSLDGEKGTIRVAALDEGVPFTYICDNQPTGFELDILYHFAKEYGYKLEVTAMTVDAQLSYLASGKADVCVGGYVTTPERLKMFNFSSPIYIGSNSFIMAHEITNDEVALLTQIKESINSTFIVEDRYLLFVDGVKSTIFITLASVLFGTIIGFISFAIFRLNNKIINAIIGALSWLVKSMPTVVLLMIMYYVIFGKTSIDGIYVSIFAFTIVFSITVLGILKTCFMAIDKGQYEASYALGYKKIETFFKIIVPQMGPMFIPSFSSEIISLIKSTSIVGYIAVSDLTKVSDIVRSRTFEAFFPLISTTIIYFVIMAVFGIVLKELEKLVDPSRRKKENILKGVKTHD